MYLTDEHLPLRRPEPARSAPEPRNSYGMPIVPDDSPVLTPSHTLCPLDLEPVYAF